MFIFKPIFRDTGIFQNRRTVAIALWSMIFCLIPLKSYPYKDLRMESPVVKAVQATKDAVVNISSEYEVQSRDYPFHGFGSDSFFDSF